MRKDELQELLAQALTALDEQAEIIARFEEFKVQAAASRKEYERKLAEFAEERDAAFRLAAFAREHLIEETLTRETR